ncbi:proline-rich protein 2-like [Neovison vison]|uniref:proline-rich protein 2-like n=1 Tax=Neovison vison TaxID=452646 RepID=UPI001CF028F0|nr:proline-rich protein 2-like [Neogale vison]
MAAPGPPAPGAGSRQGRPRHPPPASPPPRPPPRPAAASGVPSRGGAGARGRSSPRRCGRPDGSPPWAPGPQAGRASPSPHLPHGRAPCTARRPPPKFALQRKVGARGAAPAGRAGVRARLGSRAAPLPGRTPPLPVGVGVLAPPPATRARPRSRRRLPRVRGSRVPSRTQLEPGELRPGPGIGDTAACTLGPNKSLSQSPGALWGGSGSLPVSDCLPALLPQRKASSPEAVTAPRVVLGPRPEPST